VTGTVAGLVAGKVTLPRPTGAAAVRVPGIFPGNLLANAPWMLLEADVKGAYAGTTHPSKDPW